MRRRRGLFAWGLAVFVLALAWSWSLAVATMPIGASEEHFAIGQRLHRTGSLAAEDDPGVLRPPGYPAFVAATLYLRDAIVSGGGLAPAQTWADEDAVLLAQGLAVAVAATAIFAFGSTMLPPFEAACAGLVLACGPVTVALVGLLSYHLLHVLGVAVGAAQLAFAARASSGRPRDPLLAGILWGFATLVRPVTLILPPFVFLLARLRRDCDRRCAARFALLFTVGMTIPILPYAARNYAITGRLVPVNVQGGFALWATTVDRPQADEEFLSWPLLWRLYGTTLYRQVTGDQEYDLATFSTRVVELEDAFKRQALRNLKRRPSVYLHNVFNNLRRFCSDSMASWPGTFAGQNELPLPRTRTLVSAYSLGLVLLALPGLVWGLTRRDPGALTVSMLFAAIATAHAITFVNDRYTYVRLPLLAMGLAITLAAMGERSIVLGRARVRLRLAAVCAVAMLVGSAAVTLSLLAR